MPPTGIRYLRPEITLLYKAALHRPKDDRDLAVAWPLLGRRPSGSGCARPWTGSTRGHPWLDGTMAG